jgi:hypothetical protein
VNNISSQSKGRKHELGVESCTGVNAHFRRSPPVDPQLYRNVWYPRVINREEYSVRPGKWAEPFREVFRERVRWILENHRPEQLPDKVEEKAWIIVKKAGDERKT